jgi:hypothetical protein
MNDCHRSIVYGVMVSFRYCVSRVFNLVFCSRRSSRQGKKGMRKGGCGLKEEGRLVELGWIISIMLSSSSSVLPLFLMYSNYIILVHFHY